MSVNSDLEQVSASQRKPRFVLVHKREHTRRIIKKSKKTIFFKSCWIDALCLNPLVYLFQSLRLKQIASFVEIWCELDLEQLWGYFGELVQNLTQNSSQGVAKGMFGCWRLGIKNFVALLTTYSNYSSCFTACCVHVSSVISESLPNFTCFPFFFSTYFPFLSTTVSVIASIRRSEGCPLASRKRYTLATSWPGTYQVSLVQS
jgi:hypothetical protein